MFIPLRALLIVLSYTLPYTWEKRDARPQTWDGGEHDRDGPGARNSTCSGQKWDGSKYKIGIVLLYNFKEEVIMMTNRKANKVERWLPKRKYVKVLNLRKTCPLTFNERLVFSLLVYASRRKQIAGLTQGAIARLTQLDKDTVPKLVAGPGRSRPGGARTTGWLSPRSRPASE